MKVLLVFAVVVAVACANRCSNMDPSTCTHTCPTGEAKACEREVCTCAPSCALKTDCKECPDEMTPDGHTLTQTSHCIDGACECIPNFHHQPQGGSHGHQPVV